MTRRHVPVLTATAAVLALTACGGSTAPNEDVAGDGETAADIAGAPSGTLSLITGTGSSGRTFEALVSEFTQETGIEVDLRQVTADDVRQQQVLDFAAGGGGDVITVQEGWLAEFGPHLVPLEPLAEENNYESSQLIPAMADLFALNDEVLAYPARVSGRVLIYRTDLFEAAGIDEPPRTFVDLREAAEALTDAEAGTYGLVAPLVQGNDLTQNTYFPLLFSFGGALVTDDGAQAVLNNDAGQAATQYMVDLYQDGLMPPDAIEMGHDGAITAMQQGRAAMFIAYAPWFAQLNDAELSEFSESFAIAPYLPASESSGLTQGSTLLGGWGFGISKYAQNPELAWEFLEFATRPDIQTMLAVEYNNDPVVGAVFDDPAYQAVNPQADAMRSAVEGGQSVPKIASWTQAEDSIARAVTAALIGDQTVSEALDQAAREIDPSLE